MPRRGVKSVFRWNDFRRVHRQIDPANHRPAGVAAPVGRFFLPVHPMTSYLVFRYAVMCGIDNRKNISYNVSAPYGQWKEAVSMTKLLKLPCSRRMKAT